MHERLARAQALAFQLMARWGLLRPDWQFRFNKRKRSMGRCVYPATGSPGTIELSEAMVMGDNPDSLILDTILHEIAHALAGARAGHGPEWKAWCVRLGAEPERIGRGANMPAGAWQATCPKCGTLYSIHRKPKYLNVPYYYCSRPACGKRVQVLDFKRVVAVAL